MDTSLKIYTEIPKTTFKMKQINKNLDVKFSYSFLPLEAIARLTRIFSDSKRNVTLLEDCRNLSLNKILLCRFFMQIDF